MIIPQDEKIRNFCVKLMELQKLLQDMPREMSISMAYWHSPSVLTSCILDGMTADEPDEHGDVRWHTTIDGVEFEHWVLNKKNYRF